MVTKIVTREEAASVVAFPLGKKHAVRAMIEMLEPGQTLYVSRRDFAWRNGRTPNFFCRQIEKNKQGKFKVSKEASGMGWLVERVE